MSRTPHSPDARAATPGRRIRLLLCDDHAVVRAGLRALLSAEPGIEVVGEAATGEEALAVAAKQRPDVVLMDLSLGTGIDGIETTRRLVTEVPGARVLVLTTYDTDADVTRAVQVGATGYLLKAERPEELFAAIAAAAEGRAVLSAPAANRVMERVRKPHAALTDRQLDILAQLARGLGNREIARALFISEATVKTHLVRIYAKLGVDTRAGAVAAAKEQRLIP
ncbi:response regulator transcription factor [Streptomyces sp. BHT-5-2]|uniref:response regulator n=1 Tax=unclassified Streptomyces TaxID=2593676 RepID=UPI001C8D26F7|nr:response regulator transcription factor [Streptomyces sp. BHT-5-2]QZL04976.1 response regulator transcription factor [Streptomyces sp. BHT-5-2]